MFIPYQYFFQIVNKLFFSKKFYADIIIQRQKLIKTPLLMYGKNENLYILTFETKPFTTAHYNKEVFELLNPYHIHF